MSVIARASCAARVLTAAVLACLLVTNSAAAQSRVEKNVVYGMYSGLALLMDVHYPEKANGYGIIFVAGTAWQGPLAYSAPSLKESQISDWAPALLGAGYTVFTVNHRLVTRFHYPEPVEDIQRAVRFVRRNAKQFGVDPARIGGLGGSSGAHLVALVAMLAAPGIVGDADPVNREPATLQCVILRAAPTNLKTMVGSGTIATAAVVAFLNRLPTPMPDDQRVYAAASPITHVSGSSPPVLLLHGDADDSVPYQQSVAMDAVLRTANVPVNLIRVPGGVHASDFGTGGKPHQQFPEILRASVDWLDRYLRTAPTAR